MKFLVLAVIVLLQTACGATFTTDQFFEIQMYGVNQTPDGATGTVSPKFQEYVLTEVTVQSEDGSETIILYDSVADAVRISSRPQLIFSTEFSAYNETTFSGMTVAFDPVIQGESKNSKDHSFTLTDPQIVMVKEFTLETGKSLTASLRIFWKNTVTDTTMVAPAFGLDISSQ